MKNKEKYICAFLGVASIFLLGLTFFNNKIDFNSLLKASVSESISQNNKVIEAAKKMANKDINKAKEINVYTVKELINNKLLNGNEIDPNTNKEYDENTRVVVKVKDGKIEDAYITDVLFKSIYSCEQVCYLDYDNYVYFNNDLYRIMKIDQQGYIYIVNDEVKNTNKDEIDLYLKNLKNSFNNSDVINAISITNTDIEKSNIINIDNNIVVNTSSGYKIYDIDKDIVFDSNSKKVSVYPVIVLKNDITYEMGNGTKFNPFIIGG